MKEAIRRRLERVADRRAELERMLADPEALGSSARFRELSMEFARIDPIAQGLARLAARERELAAARAMAADPDAGLRALAEQEVAALERAAGVDEADLLRMLVPADPLDGHNVFLEIRAAAGGDEAAIFAGDLQRMYARYAERRGWSIEILSESRGEHGGYREVISRIAGRGAYAALKFESGTHRVQRVPATEAQGRIHTSTCTVAVLP
jgi:peptide chain release factor 1